MKTYTVLLAQDIPHYGSVDIEAENDADALARAKAYWKAAERGDQPWPLYDAQHDSAVLARVVNIFDSDREVAYDIRLDEYLLNRAPTELDARIFDNAKLTYQALEAVMDWWQNTAHTDDDEMPADIFDQAQDALAKITNDGWRLLDFDNTGLLHIEKDDAANSFLSDAHAVDYVRLLAASGNLNAQRALRLHELNQPNIDELRSQRQSTEGGDV